MLKKWAAGFLILSTSGCALLFQEHLPAGYKPESSRGAPRCSTSAGLEVLDILFGALDALAIGEVLSQPTRTDNDTAALVVAIAEALLHLGSAHSGGVWVKECEAAISVWDHDGGNHAPDSGASATVEAAIHPPPRAPDPVITVTIVPPAAFHCFTSPTDGNLGLCTRSFADCAGGHDREVGSTVYLSACTDAAIADCFHYTTVVDGVAHEVCGPTMATCNHRRDAAIAIGPSVGDVGECAETK